MSCPAHGSPRPAPAPTPTPRTHPLEVNLVNLERVGFNLRNFDMVLVWKDLGRDVGRIDSIPSTSLDTIKVGVGVGARGSQTLRVGLQPLSLYPPAA